MPNLLICKCYVRESIIGHFKELYGENCSKQLAEFSLGLLVSRGIKMSELFEEKIVKFNNANPYLELVVDEEIQGNNSHMYFFIDTEYETIKNMEQFVSFYKR